MNVKNLVSQLKENNEDFEFYPTTKEMIKPIYDRLNRSIDVLDIGAGTCNFKKYFEEFANEQDRIYCEKENMFRNSYIDGKDYNYDLRPSSDEQGKHIEKYYVIEKSRTLINKFDIEFAKAMNVEVSRLLGWIRSKEDIQKEFTDEMAKGAEKYFKQNYSCISNNAIKLLCG